MKYIFFELFSILGLAEMRAKVPKHSRSIVDWHIRWSFKTVDFKEKEVCFNLSLDKEDWLLIKDKIPHNNLSGVLD